MHCPNPSCYESPERPHLLITERSGIEIDYCPKCRGVWLDRGELDKLIERAQQDLPPPTPQPGHSYDQPPAHGHRPDYHKKEQRHYDSDYKRYDDDYKRQGYGHQYGKKKKSLLSEIFDF